jgi:two-component system cell cycle response regulator CtrA
MRVLLIEDDTSTAKSIELMLKSEGYVCDSTDLGEDGLDIGKIYDYDLIVLDLMLPDIDGLEVLRRLRTAKVQTPILILSGLSQPDDKVKALTLGADDYLTKPFDKEELIARLRAIVRRANGHPDTIIRTGGLAINLDARTVTLDGQPLHTTRREYAILELLSLRKGSALTKEMIMSHLYGGMDEPQIKIIDVYICHLRKKLSAAGGENLIETVWGRGYLLREPDPARVPDMETPPTPGTDEVQSTAGANG